MFYKHAILGFNFSKIVLKPNTAYVSGVKYVEELFKTSCYYLTDALLVQCRVAENEDKENGRDTQRNRNCKQSVFAITQLNQKSFHKLLFNAELSIPQNKWGYNDANAKKKKNKSPNSFESGLFLRKTCV